MRALVGVHGFKVDHVAHDLEVLGDAVATVHITRHPRHVQSLAAVVTLHHRDHFRGGFARVHQATNLQTPLQAQSNLGLHIREFLLKQLCLRERLAELLAIKPVLQCGMPAGLCRTHHTPRDAVTCAVQAAKWPFEALHIGEQCVFANFHVLHDDLASDGGA